MNLNLWAFMSVLTIVGWIIAWKRRNSTKYISSEGALDILKAVVIGASLGALIAFIRVLK